MNPSGFYVDPIKAMTARNKVLTIMGIIILMGVISIGFFVFPIGISMCAITGLCYGCKYKDKLFIRWSSVGLVIGIGLSIYTWCLISSM